MNLSKKDIINICKIVAFGIILYWGLQNVTWLGNGFKTICGILSPFIWGAAIAFVVNIPMTIFEKKIFVSKKKEKNKKEAVEKISKPKRILSILISIAIIILELINVISNLIQYHLPKLYIYMRDITNEAINNYPQIASNLTNLQKSLEGINSEVIKELTTLGTSLVTSSFGVITSVINVVIKIMIAVIFAGYILMSKEKLSIHLKRLTYAFFEKKTADKICEIANLSRNSFYDFITGQLVECIILGSLCALGMCILRMPYAATVGSLVAITAFIPIVGALIGGAVGAILILPISLKKAIIFVIFFIILQQLENNLIYPRVVGGRVGLPGILVLIAVAIGGNLGGAIGMVICLPVTAVLYTLLMASVNKRLKEKGLERNIVKDEK